VPSDHVAQAVEGEGRVTVVANHAAGGERAVVLIARLVDVADGIQGSNLGLPVEPAANQLPAAVVNEFGFAEMRIHERRKSVVQVPDVFLRPLGRLSSAHAKRSGLPALVIVPVCGHITWQTALDLEPFCIVCEVDLSG
jgi:hypothetical protein